MEKKGFKWQMVVEILFMGIIIAALFMPALQISGEKYLKIAVKINEYAKDQDAKTASEVQVDKKIINKYKRNTSSWNNKIKEFDDEIDKADKGSSISQIMYIKWLLTVDDEIDDIKGINKISGKSNSKKGGENEKKDTTKIKHKNVKKKNKNVKQNKKKKQSSNNSKNKVKQSEKKLSDSDVKIVFKLMAVIMIIPALVAIAGIILVIVTGKTKPIFAVASGVFILLLRVIYSMAMPYAIWKTISDYVESLTLVNKKILAIDNVGVYSVNKIMTECTGIGIYVTVVSAFMLMLFGILFMTILKPIFEVEEDMEWDFGIDARRINNDFRQISQPLTENLNNDPDVNGFSDISNDYAGNFTISGDDNGISNSLSLYDKGYIYGINGQYRSFNMQIESGEEIILGRDPKQAMLVFEYPKVSRKHCGIRYDAVSGMYYIIDYSSNGIELSDGTVVKAGEYVSVAPGTILYLAGKHEALKLG